MRQETGGQVGRIATLGLVLVTIGSAARAAAGDDTLESPVFGFSVRAPRDWTVVPTNVEDRWLVGKFLSDKEYSFNDSEGWTWQNRPEMTVVAFVEGSESDAELEADEASGSIRIRIDTPYEDYEDYLDTAFRGRGFYIDETDEKKSGGVPVTVYEIKIEKQVTAPMHATAWVYHLDGVDVAVQFVFMEEHLSKLKSTLSRSFKSFKEIERTADELPDQSRWITFEDMTQGTPQERRKKRMESELQHREQVQASLPDGWEAEQVGKCFVVRHVDKRYAEDLVEQVEAVLAWLDATLPFVGPEEYVREPILRICASRDEENAFRRGGDGWYVGTEIVTCRDRDDWTDWEVGWVNTAVIRHWLRERNLPMSLAMPQWLIAGLTEYFQDARLKGSKLAFRTDDWQRHRMREIERDGALSTPREIMLMDSRSFYAGNDLRNHRQANALVNFFFSGKASRSAKGKELLKDYVRNLQEVVAEIQAEEDANEPSEEKPKTEEEEEKLFKERRTRWTKRERRILDETFERTFAGWSDKDWTSFEKAYFDSVN